MDERGYIIPSPIDPHELVCFRVYVPKDSLYIGAFWSAYQYFTSWLAWAKDPLRRGKVAASVWRVAFYKARAEFELNKGTCEMNITGLRQNPNNACELQVEFDGNNQWQTVADLSKCSSCGGSGAMQFDGTNVNIFNDCNGQFEPSATPFNPQTQGIYDSLYAPDESGACNGAANIAQYVHKIATDTLTALNAAALVGTAVDLVMGTLGMVVGGGIVAEALLGSMLELITLYGDLLGDAAALDISTEMKQIIFRHISTDGTLKEPEFTQLVTELYQRRDAEAIDTAERVRWGHEANLISALGPFLISKKNKYAGITDADCTDAGWSKTFDLILTNGGWFNIPDEANPDGTWVSGQGWKPTIGAIDTRTNNNLRLQYFIPARTVTYISYTYTAIGGEDATHPTENANFIGHDGSDTDLAWTALTDGEGLHFSWSGSQALSEVRLGMQVGTTTTPPFVDAGSGKIVSITLRGEGVSPFPG